MCVLNVRKTCAAYSKNSSMFDTTPHSRAQRERMMSIFLHPCGQREVASLLVRIILLLYQSGYSQPVWCTCANGQVLNMGLY